MADKFTVTVERQQDGNYFATAKSDDGSAYGHGLTALAACINALANAHFEDLTETEPGHAS